MNWQSIETIPHNAETVVVGDVNSQAVYIGFGWLTEKGELETYILENGRWVKTIGLTHWQLPEPPIAKPQEGKPAAIDAAMKEQANPSQCEYPHAKND